MFRPPPLPRTLDAALRDVGEPKPAVRVDAIADLVPHGEAHRAKVLGALEKLLADPEPRVRAAALRGLAELGAHELLPALLVACEDEDASVRQEAIASLGDIGDDRASGKLERALLDPRPEVRFQAVMAYPRVCASRADAVDALVRATHDDDPLVVQVALRMAETLLPERAAGPGDRDGGGGGGWCAQGEDRDVLDDLEKEGAEVVPRALLERARALLSHASPRVRVVAAIVVTRAGEEAGREVVAQVASGTLVTPEAEDVAAAIGLAGRFGLKSCVRALERRAFGGVLGFGRDAWAWHARTALARMGHERAVSDVLRELQASDRTRRTLAVVAAGKAHLEVARPHLVRMKASPRGVDLELIERALRSIPNPGDRSPGDRSPDDVTAPPGAVEGAP